MGSDQNRVLQQISTLDSYSTPMLVELSIEFLPDEISCTIFSYLSILDLFQTSLVCKSWYRLANSNSLWVSIFFNN
jgi:hypothetical protein